MDSLISAALEEICSQGERGLSISSLWSKLNAESTLSPSIKASVYSNLLKIPSLQFLSRDGAFRAEDALIERLEDAEELDLRIIACSQLRDNFIGLYDTSLPTAGSSAVQKHQRRALERLATARSDGITQSQLAKEFGIEGKNFFYIVRNLETKGLIVRQPAVVWTKEPSSEGESKNSSCVHTNLVYLYRYAKHLGSQQRFEFCKEPVVGSCRKADEMPVTEDGCPGKNFRDDVHIKDYIPSMRAICDKLEQANGRVLVVSDIKQDLGYSGSSSQHKTWRSVCQRLKDAGMVEEFDAKVNDKVERCLRLLKSYSSKSFEQNFCGSGDNLEKEPAKFGRRSRETEQLVELPIEHQIYDMVDAGGSEGLTLMEVFNRLGIDRKKCYSRTSGMLSKFGMHLQEENHKRTTAYRVRTSANSNSKSSNAFLNISESPHHKSDTSSLDDGNSNNVSHGGALAFLEYDHSTSQGDIATTEQKDNMEADTNVTHGSSEDGNPQGLLLELSGKAVARESNLENKAMEVVPSETKHLTLLNLHPSPSLSLTPDGLRRERRILDRLQDEKFILKSELHRWLKSFEKDRSTTIDRKSIKRILIKLQQEGRCKCLHISVPYFTNCGRNRFIDVVLHPSIENLTPNVLNKIHDRLRCFEMQVRGRNASRRKDESVPVLDDVERIQSRDLDDQSGRNEAMRTNGYVIAKMVRVKLLHSFLWEYLSSSPSWKDALSSKKFVPAIKDPHSSCILFSLELAIKNIPLELFLQVVGSTQKFDDMIERCKRGLCLSDLPVEEYKLLMDTRATAKLSSLVDVLQRLKLIRLVSNEYSNDGFNNSHASLSHAMELKPYIEEPPSTVATSNMKSPDLRPRIRHDFFLTNGEAVNEYWRTLEYCYAATDPRAALHAFPGCAVDEVSHHRSWTSVRVMKASQRAELLKHVVNAHGKLPFRECEKIAKDLNLSLGQVLRVYYDKQQQRLSGFQDVPSPEGKERQSLKAKCASSSKRKRSLEGRSIKHMKVDVLNGQLDGQRVAASPDAADRESDVHPLEYQGANLRQTVEDPASEENEEYHSTFFDQAFSKRKQSRAKRFTWTDETDRQLVIEYVRYRAAVGAKFQRTCWASVPNLPVAPSTCAKRMSSLKRNAKFREAVLKLCNLLSERFVNHHKQARSMLPNYDCGKLLQFPRKENCNEIVSNGVAQDSDLEGKRWDDFNDEDIKRALEDALQLKRIAKLETSKRVGSVSRNWSNHAGGPSCVTPTSHSDQSHGLGQHKDAARSLNQKFAKLLHEGNNDSSQVVESLAISNAIELFKLVFLSSSRTPELEHFLAKTLRRYSERDLFAAFSFLREKKFMIGGNGSPFVLSQYFLNSLSKSPFPADAGKRAAKFSTWLYEREKDLIGGGTDLVADLQCGDVFQLFSLVSSGELSISPCLPEEGVGEAEDLRGMKHRSEEIELCEGEKAKKLKTLSDNELISRREKGFPGIKVSVRRATILPADALEVFKDSEINTDGLHKHAELSCPSDYMKDINNCGCVVPQPGSSLESPWEAMTAYAMHLLGSDQKQASSISPQVFEGVYAAIQRAGDQGVNVKEIPCVTNVSGEMICECIIDVLQAFGRVLKVNAYNTVRVVDTLYRSKYFCTSSGGLYQDLGTQSLKKYQKRGYDSDSVQTENDDIHGANSRREEEMDVDDVHKVTILNLPEVEPGQTNIDAVLPGLDTEDESHKKSPADVCIPILPWINGDGTVNAVVYNGLLRRVLGIVMQNPGMLEDEIISQMDVLNPQSCKKLLELMILDKHLIVRKMHQTTYIGPPAILGSLLGNNFSNRKMVYREHFFANSMITSLL